jgi:hypothetical protein
LNNRHTHSSAILGELTAEHKVAAGAGTKKVWQTNNIQHRTNTNNGNPQTQITGKKKGWYQYRPFDDD